MRTVSVGGLRISSDEDDRTIFLVLQFLTPVFFGWENFDLRGDFLAYTKHSEVVILHNVTDETEDVLGCLECC